MQLTPKQELTILNKSRFKVLNWGRRSGKTTLFAYEALGTALTVDDAHVTYYAMTHGDARDIAWKIFLDVFGEAVVSKNETLLEIRVRNLKGGTSLVSLKGWESVILSGKGRGTENDLILADEVAFCRQFMEYWDKVLAPTLLTSKGRAVFGSTPNGFNDFYDLTVRAQSSEDWFYLHATSYDNPMNEPEEIERIKKEITEDRFAQEYLADFRKLEGLVYKEFRRDVHVYTDGKPANPIKYFAGIDFGFTNPTAVISIEKDWDNSFWVTSEWYKPGKTDIEIAEYVSALRFEEVYPDPESPSAIEELKKANVYCREVVKNKDSIKNGISKIRALFMQGKIHIHSSCTNLIWELENYRYPDKRMNNNEQENPIKENDHACFTADTKIEGDILYTKSTGFKDVYEFIGSKVTADHPYLTQRGFVRLDSLRYSDKLVIWKHELLMELSLGDTQTQTGVSFVTILYLLQRNLQAIKQNVYTDIYGKNITGKYLRAFISTIKTVTHLITTYLISNLYHKRSTLLNTIKIGRVSFKNGLRQVKMLLQNGLKHQKDKSSEANMEKSMQNTSQDTQSLEIAMNVIENTQLRRSLANTATIIAGLKHCGKEEVFASVSRNGYFFANGVLVSNCDALRYAIYMEEPVNIFNEIRIQDRVNLNRQSRKAGFE
jgi:hypothetical protein